MNLIMLTIVKAWLALLNDVLEWSVHLRFFLLLKLRQFDITGQPNTDFIDYQKNIFIIYVNLNLCILLHFVWI